MRKITLLYLLLIASASLSAQNITLSNADGPVSNGDTISATGYTNAQIIMHVYVTNNSSSPIDILAKKKYISLVSGAEAVFCWAGSCWGANVFVSADYQTLGAGVTDMTSYSADYNPNGNEGTSLVLYTLFNRTNENDSASFIAKFTCVPPSGMQKIVDAPLISSAYPNPANKNTYISYSLPSLPFESFLIVNDIMGNEVISIPVTEKEGTLKIDTYMLPDGIYFYSFIYDRRILTTKKLIVSHK